jgi:hypothetical protein
MVLTDLLLKATTDLMQERFFAFSTYVMVMETSIAQAAKQQPGSNNVLLSSVPRPSIAKAKPWRASRSSSLAASSSYCRQQRQ